jgi:hypothetical protein
MDELFQDGGILHKLLRTIITDKFQEGVMGHGRINFNLEVPPPVPGSFGQRSTVG